MAELSRTSSFKATATMSPTPPPSAVLSSSTTGMKYVPSSRETQQQQPSHHWSVFYEKDGIENLPPTSLHYLHLGCWTTDTCDFYLHRRPKKGEHQGQTVIWLHNAMPRDRFVFLITPVDEPGKHNLYALLWSFLYGNPPAFNVTSDRKNLFDALKKRRKEKDRGPKLRTGVEAVEVLHSDVTAMDYGPGLTTSRLAIETKTARCKWFLNKEEALKYYNCLGDAKMIEERFTTPAMPSISLPSTPALTMAHDGLKMPPPLCLNDGEVSGRSSRNISPQLGPTSGPNSRQGSFNGQPLPDDGLDDIDMPPSATGSNLVSSNTLSPAELDAVHNELSRRSSVHTPLPPPAAEATCLPDVGAAKSAASAACNQTPASAASPGTTDGKSRGGSHKDPIVSPYHNTMVIIYTQDPHFNAVLREFLVPEPGTHPYAKTIHDQKRLLSLYETGMPAWPIFFSRYGLPYRRWFRLVAVAIINIWPIIALCVGLYDLYKHMPFLKEWMAESLTPFTQWIEDHIALQVSILATYLVTVTFNIFQSFHSFVKSAIAIFTFAFSPLLPILSFFSILKYPVLIVWQFLIAPIVSTGFSGLNFIWVTLTTPFRVISYGFQLMFGANQVKNTVQSASYFMVWWRSWLEFWDKVARPIKNLAKAFYDGTVHLGVAIARREASLRRWYTAMLFKLTALIRFTLRTALDVFYYNVVVIHYQQLRWSWLPFIFVMALSVVVAWFVWYLRNGGVLPLAELFCGWLDLLDHQEVTRQCDRFLLSLASEE